ncbi:MAG: hypothetical protein U0L72_03885 [Acutalibacteraceae bacterium]|jgi:hypothetical protein|nr:hypothetical protein [Acutalibacteraceae bacterium]
MKYQFEKVIDGMVTYINDEMFMGMNDWQEMTARILVARVVNNQEAVKKALIDNGFIRTFGIIDSEGMVDVCGLANDIKQEIVKKGKMTFTVPMFGKISFLPSDVDKLYKNITGEELRTYENN